MENRKCKCGVLLTPETAYLSRQRNRLQSACKKCQRAYTDKWLKKNREKERERARLYYKNNYARLRVTYERSRVIRKYGITPDQITSMKIAQNNLCVICQSRPCVAVDHDHISGSVRAILCQQCNTVLGLMEENTTMLFRAIAYLKIYSDENASLDDDMLSYHKNDIARIINTLRQSLCVKG